MRISARNQVAGTVAKLTVGVVNAEVVISLPGGGQLVAVITKGSAKTLNLKRGSPVVAIIKSSDVLVAVPCGNPDCKCR
ncbi:MAG: molybdopterin-binding protein [Verrucomicrobiales bacterium]|nr:molybdopterin-binding protein [Verrucomicrobiales bacterium]